MFYYMIYMLSYILKILIYVFVVPKWRRPEDQEASEGRGGARDALRAELKGGDEQQALGVPQQRGEP